MITERETSACRVCGGHEIRERMFPREMMFGTREKFTYNRCAFCDCLQIDKIPADLARHYPADYYSYQISPDRPPSFKRRLKIRLLHPAMTRHLLWTRSIGGHLLCRFLDSPSIPFWLRFLNKPVSFNGRVLDVGCGSGLNLLALRDCGFTNLLGVDPFISKPLWFRGGIKVEKCELHEVQGKFDLIMFHHVFEHLGDPFGTLRTACRLLAEGGQVLIRIPLSDSLAAQKYRENWVQMDAPRHIMLHSRKSMNLLAKLSGFKITRVTYDSSEFQFWASEQYLLDIPLLDPRSVNSGPSNTVFSQGQLVAFSKEADQLNKQEKGDQAAFVLEHLT